MQPADCSSKLRVRRLLHKLTIHHLGSRSLLYILDPKNPSSTTRRQALILQPKPKTLLLALGPRLQF